MTSAVTEESGKTLREYLQGFRRRRRALGAVFALILALGLAVAYGLPPVYRSTATILIEQQEIPQDLVRSTVTSYADQRVQVISQRVMTSANLSAIVRKYDLYAAEREREPFEAVLVRMREQDIALDLVSADVVDPRSGKAVKATIAFQLSYSNREPELAQKVANELVSLFLNENLKNRASVAEESSSFLAEEAGKVKARVTALELRLAQFKESNAGRLPELTNINLQLLDRTEGQVLETQRALGALEERRFMLEGQLALLQPTLEGPSSRADPTLTSPAERLKAVQTAYLSLAARYSADHPDVVRARKEMEGLSAAVSVQGRREALAAQREAVAAELAAASQKYSPEHPDVRGLRRELEALEAQVREATLTPLAVPEQVADAEPNPAHVQLSSQLRSTEFEIASQRAKLEELRGRVADYEQRLTAVPQVEREYRELLRDYEMALAEYREVTAKQTQAELAESLETEQKGERFTLIEPPLLPEQPSSPNRPAIAFLGVVFALAGGVSAVAVAEAMDHAVYGARGAAQAFGAAPLAVIPRISPRGGRRKRTLVGVGAAVALAATGLLLTHLALRPLDVLYFGLLDRLGL